MKAVFILYLLILGLKCYQSPYKASPFVQELKGDQLPLLAKGVWLVNYYSPSNKASRDFAEEFVKVARTFRHLVRAAAIDVSKELTDVDPNSCPMIRFYADGKAYNYLQSLKAPPIMSFLKTMLSNVISNRLKTYPQLAGSSDSSKRSPHTTKDSHHTGDSQKSRKGRGSNKQNAPSPKALTLKNKGEFKTAFQIANPLPTNMQILSNQVISEKR